MFNNTYLNLILLLAMVCDLTFFKFQFYNVMIKQNRNSVFNFISYLTLFKPCFIYFYIRNYANSIKQCSTDMGSKNSKKTINIINKSAQKSI